MTNQDREEMLKLADQLREYSEQLSFADKAANALERLARSPDPKVTELESELSAAKDKIEGLTELRRVLEAENAALRHALQRIADESYDEGCYESPETIARFAIAKESSHDN